MGDRSYDMLGLSSMLLSSSFEFEIANCVIGTVLHFERRFCVRLLIRSFAVQFWLSQLFHPLHAGVALFGLILPLP